MPSTVEGIWQSLGKDIVALIGLSLLGAFVAGGNHVTALLQSYSVKPKLLYFSDIKRDPTDGRNSSMTQFYGKNSVRLKKKK